MNCDVRRGSSGPVDRDAGAAPECIVDTVANRIADHIEAGERDARPAPARRDLSRRPAA